MNSKKGISVVIPNYNGKELLRQIIPPLYEALLQTSLPYEIIVSDDCSRDGSVELIKNSFPEIILLEGKSNSGFSPTINRGIFVAKNPLVLLLNNDVKLEPDYFKYLLPYFDDENTFGVAGRIIGWDNDTIQDGGKYPSFHGAKIKTSGNYIPVPASEDEKFFSMYLSGANALVDCEKLISLGGFDEIFAPFYVEDFDLSLRAWRLGWECFYEQRAVCRHRVSATIKLNKRNYVKTIYNRNKMFLHAIHLKKAGLLFWYLQLIPETFLHMLTGRLFFLKSIGKFLNSLDRVRASRKKLAVAAKGRLLSVKEVTGKILRSLEGKNISRF